MKLNVIASGQIVAGFTTEQGMALTGEVAKLGEKLEGLMRDQDKQMNQAKEEASTGVEQVMKETKSVFDAIIKDVEQLQNEVEKLKGSSAIEELESHLTERITMLS